MLILAELRLTNRLSAVLVSDACPARGFSELHCGGQRLARAGKLGASHRELLYTVEATTLNSLQRGTTALIEVFCPL